jgi:hypothetical protein
MATVSESVENRQRSAVRTRIVASYLQVTARAPTDDQVAVWTDLIAGGATSDDLMDHLYATPALERRATLISAGGPTGAWSHLVPVMPSRWDPCRSVSWRMNPAGAPPGARTDVREAFRRVAAATGLVFVEGPDTAHVPTTGPPPPEGVVYLAYSTTAVVPGLAGAAGMGGFYTEGEPRGGFSPIDSGLVVINRDTSAGRTPGFAPGAHGSVLLHEIAHAVGLGHTSVSGQAMYPSVDGAWQGRRWGNGDRTGLGVVGAAQGCFPSDRTRPDGQPRPLIPVVAP